MWSVENAQSDQTINYLVVTEPCNVSQLESSNVIKMMNLSFMPKEAESIEKLTPIVFCVVVFKDAKKVLTEQEIISEVSKYKAPFAEYIDSEVLF
ncbi:MAG: hypothetical protein MJZ65_04470 [Paludibacteraceae bacterium]|nr:hypothetical protein [Paludibacteraceae bacterium]